MYFTNFVTTTVKKYGKRKRIHGVNINLKDGFKFSFVLLSRLKTLKAENEYIFSLSFQTQKKDLKCHFWAQNFKPFG